MIGFDLKARGVIPEDLKIGKPFTFHDNKWTEGDMEILKLALIAPAGGGKMVSPSGSFQLGGLTAAVRDFAPEKIFNNIMQSKLLDVCASRWDCRLWVHGDVTFNFHLEPKKAGMQNLQGFIDRMHSLSTRLGDQVVISLCDALHSFQIWCIARGITDPVGLDVELDL